MFYRCDQGLVPEERMNATCTDSGWSPNPADLNCTEGASGASHNYRSMKVEIFVLVRPCQLGLYREYILLSV